MTNTLNTEECLTCHEMVATLNEDGECETCAAPKGCQHEFDVTRHYSRFGVTTWQCEECGATTMETDVDADEDGRGIRETPDWG